VIQDNNIPSPNGDDIYLIVLYGQTTPQNVRCDMSTDGGGWTVSIFTFAHCFLKERNVHFV